MESNTIILNYTLFAIIFFSMELYNKYHLYNLKQKPLSYTNTILIKNNLYKNINEIKSTYSYFKHDKVETTYKLINNITKTRKLYFNCNKLINLQTEIRTNTIDKNENYSLINSIKKNILNTNHENTNLYLDNISLSYNTNALYYANGANLKKNYLLLNVNFRNHPYENEIIEDIESKFGHYAYKHANNNEHELVLYEIKINNISISSKWDDGKTEILLGTILSNPGYISKAKLTIQVIDRRTNEIIRSLDCYAIGIKKATEEEANEDVFKNRIGNVVIESIYAFFPPMFEIKDITAYNRYGDAKEFSTNFGSNHGIIKNFEYNVIGVKDQQFTELGTAKILGELGIVHSNFTIISGYKLITNAVNNGSKIYIINKSIQIPVINYKAE